MYAMRCWVCPIVAVLAFERASTAPSLMRTMEGKRRPIASHGSTGGPLMRTKETKGVIEVSSNGDVTASQVVGSKKKDNAPPSWAGGNRRRKKTSSEETTTTAPTSPPASTTPPTSSTPQEEGETTTKPPKDETTKPPNHQQGRTKKQQVFRELLVDAFEECQVDGSDSAVEEVQNWFNQDPGQANSDLCTFCDIVQNECLGEKVTLKKSAAQVCIYNTACAWPKSEGEVGSWVCDLFPACGLLGKKTMFGKWGSWGQFKNAWQSYDSLVQRRNLSGQLSPRSDSEVSPPISHGLLINRQLLSASEKQQSFQQAQRSADEQLDMSLTKKESVDC